MPNMSYCRWENTAGDLNDCVCAQAEPDFDFEKLGEHEKGGYDEILRAAVELIASADVVRLQELDLPFETFDAAVSQIQEAVFDK